MDSKSHKDIHMDNIYYDNEGNVIEGGCIKEFVVCIRPGHKSGLPKVYAEYKNTKIISHNYCHSGLGYSILFGTVEKSIENFQKLRLDRGVSLNEQITVIGIGCIGLVTALTLYFRGYRNIKIIGEKFFGIPSQYAGGLVDISLYEEINQSNVGELKEFFKYTYSEYQSIVNGKHKFIKYGVREVDYYADYLSDSGLKYLSDIEMIPKCKKVLLQIGNSNKHREFFHYKTFHVYTQLFMTSLLYTAIQLNIPIDYRKVNSFDEIKSTVIFNCTGLGSKELNNDYDCYPICGHGIVLNDDDNGKLDYIIRMANIPELNGHPINGAIHFMPKSTGYIGGSYIKEYDGKNEKFNKEIINKLVERSKFLFNSIQPINMLPKF